MWGSAVSLLFAFMACHKEHELDIQRTGEKPTIIKIEDILLDTILGISYISVFKTKQYT